MGAQRKEKEQAMHERFEKRIEEGLEKILPAAASASSCPQPWGSASDDCSPRTHERQELLKSKSCPMPTALRSSAGRKSTVGGSEHGSARVVMCAQTVCEVASKTSDVAGDGTTTATLLAQSIFREGVRTVAAGASPMALKRGIDKAVELKSPWLRSRGYPGM
jgi:hypothetical protein